MPEFDEIYMTLLGELPPEDALPWVENAFFAGSHCQRAWLEIGEACQRIRQRLEAEEDDEDLEIILMNQSDIQKELCERMFEAGMEYIQEKRYLPGA